MKTVKQVAGLAGVTVRTLHHYDEIGLLRPDGRSQSGYRVYSHADLERLQEILAWRELGFSLAEIAELIDDPDYDRSGALRRQRELVERERERLARLGAALDAAIAAADDGEEQDVETMFEGFDAREHQQEARERWSDTPQWGESQRRTRGYREDQWRSIRAEAEAIAGEFAALHAAGVPAGSAEAGEVVGRHREHISRWFYDCSVPMHRALAEMYVADPRFTKTWERHGEGLAVYVRDAILAV